MRLLEGFNAKFKFKANGHRKTSICGLSSGDSKIQKNNDFYDDTNKGPLASLVCTLKNVILIFFVRFNFI